jgi:hypothetical protein
MKRRLTTIMARSGAKTLFEYYQIIARDPEKRQEFKDFVTINVSEFFRIPDKFTYLRRNVLPQLLKERRRLNIWSAGCSNGSEPYSLAMILDELMPGGGWHISATDIDATILDRARRGAGLVLYELDGDRSGATGIYAAAASVLLHQSDLLVAVWDGGPSAGSGGTVATLGRALQDSIPVVWVDARTPHAWRLLREPSDLTAVTAASPAEPPAAHDDSGAADHRRRRDGTGPPHRLFRAPLAALPPG